MFIKNLLFLNLRYLKKNKYLLLPMEERIKVDKICKCEKLGPPHNKIKYPSKYIKKLVMTVTLI